MDRRMLRGRTGGVVVALAGAALLAWAGPGHAGPDEAAVPAPPAVNVDRRITAFPVQLTRERTGVVLIDADAGTIWVYEFVPPTGEAPGAMRLYAGRTWMYDRALQNYNQVGVQPDEVKTMVQMPAPATSPAGGAGVEAPAAPAPSRAIQAVPVQIDRDRFGLAMVDLEKGTVWVYDFVTTDPKTPNAMRLYAARTWLYDRALEAYRNLAPLPDDVFRQVQRQTGVGVPASQPARR